MKKLVASQRFMLGHTGGFAEKGDVIADDGTINGKDCKGAEKDFAVLQALFDAGNCKLVEKASKSKAKVAKEETVEEEVVVEDSTPEDSPSNENNAE